MTVARRGVGLAPARRRHSVLVTLVLVLALVAAACGTTDRDEPAVLRLVMSEDWARAPALVDAIRDFERAHPAVRVDLRGVLFEHVAETVRAGVSTGNPADIVQWHAFAAGAQGLAEPLDDLWGNRLNETELLAGAVDDVTWAGRRYGVPLDSNAMLLIYDAERLGTAGVPLPSDAFTFGNLEGMARTLTSPDGSRRALAIPSSTWHTFGWIKANGGGALEVGDDGRPRFTFDSPQVVEALSFLAGLVRKRLAFAPIGEAGDRINAFELFRSGNAAMHFSGSWDLATLRKEEGSSRYQVSPMPKGMGGTTGTAMGGSSLFVPRGSRHRDLAVAFMLHLTSDRYALRLAKEEGRLPPRPGVYRDAFFQTPDLQAFLEQLESAHPFKLEAFPEPHKAFARAVEEVLSGRTDAATALRTAQARANASLGGR